MAHPDAQKEKVSLQKMDREWSAAVRVLGAARFAPN